MHKLTVYSESCSIWNDGQLEKTGLYELDCEDCLSESSLSIIKSEDIWKWDIYIPPDWTFGDWYAVRLFLVKLKKYVVKCEICNAKYRVYPSFVLPGTSLTLFALIFIAFVYERSRLTWRDLPKYFCHVNNMIVHSTLYKAVHGLAGSLCKYNCIVSEGKHELVAKYLPAFGRKNDATQWPGNKSIFAHTIERENALRFFLSDILSFDRDNVSFFKLFHTYVKKARIVLSNIDPTVRELYYSRNRML